MPYPPAGDPAFDVEDVPAVTGQQELRIARINALGLLDLSDLDAVADRVAQALELPYAMVNLITNVQLFAGLHVDADRPQVSRTMRVDHGFCPDLLDRRRPLVLSDVHAVPRFAGNRVVDTLGIRAYVGAPLIDPRTEVVVGTVCAVGTEPTARDQAQRRLVKIKSFQAEITMRIAEIDARTSHT